MYDNLMVVVLMLKAVLHQLHQLTSGLRNSRYLTGGYTYKMAVLIPSTQWRSLTIIFWCSLADGFSSEMVTQVETNVADGVLHPTQTTRM
jgi:hypothetical protein